MLSQHDGLIILRLDTYTFLGGAHGMPVTRYLVIDTGRKQILTLHDMLRPGQHRAFEQRSCTPPMRAGPDNSR
ncbi:MAG: hypothetical protein WBL23_18155 [Salinisphaera sp.]|uniref:hypothetical protein n=1 Tax=Salinisphaera sp. TaxID=1914330 RepID=UPI003C7A1A66